MRLVATLAVMLSFAVIVADAQLQISALSGYTNDYQISASLVAGQTVTLTSATAHSKALLGFEVWSSVRYKAFTFTLANGVESSTPVVIGGGPAFETYQWKTPSHDFIVLGNTAGVDAFEMKITNLDSTATADVYVVFHYSI